MNKKDIAEIKTEILEKMSEKEEEVKSILYIEEMQLLESNNEYFGLNENDVFLVKKEQEVNKEKVTTYDIFSKEGELIGKADEQGNVELTEEYKEKLQEKYKSLYKQLGMDKRKVKISNIEKYSEKEAKEKNEDIKEKADGVTTLEEKESKTKKEDKQEEIENPDRLSENEQVNKIEESLGLDKKDIKSSSEIIDQEFYKIVPEAKEYKGNVSIVYVGSTNEFMIVGVDKKTGQYKPLETVEASRATEVGETNRTIDVSRDGNDVEARSLKAIINIKGDNEYSFSAKLEGLNPIELKELRRDPRSGEYISADLETNHQYPVTQKVADLMDADKNKYVSEEVDKYKKEVSEGKKITNLNKIADDKLNKNHGDTKNDKQNKGNEEKNNKPKGRQPGGRTPYDDWAKKHGIE